MAKLKGELISLGKQLHKGFQQCGIGLKIRRCLEKNWSQLARLAHRFQAFQIGTNGTVSVFQSPEMCDHLVGFGSKTEISE